MRAEDLAELNLEQIQAMVFALSVRNGIENLHAAGLIGDPDMPRFNRAVRNQLYMALVAIKHVIDEHHPHHEFLVEKVLNWELVDLQAERLPIDDGIDTARHACLGACREAVRRFSADTGLTPMECDELEGTAIVELDEAMSLVWDQDPQVGYPEALNFLVTSIPEYWEPPELQADFAARLT